MGSDEWAPEQISLGGRAKGRPALERQGGSRTDMFEVSSDNLFNCKGEGKQLILFVWSAPLMWATFFQRCGPPWCRREGDSGLISGDRALLVNFV